LASNRFGGARCKPSDSQPRAYDDQAKADPDAHESKLHLEVPP
jgi:hypothetical protein